MNEPWLTVVMPVHRAGAWLDEALASIASQSKHGSIAVIIRDSTPEGPCTDLIEPHHSHLPIDYEYLPDVPSWPRKTNMGVEAAQSEHVCTLHQDDIWLDGRATLVQNMIDQHPDAALYVTASSIIDPDSKVLGQWTPPFDEGVQDFATYRDRLLVQNSIAMPAPIWKRDAYLASGGLDETLWYTPDWDLWIKLADQGRVVCNSTPSTAFRIHASSLTMTGDRKEMERELETVLARYAVKDQRMHALTSASVKVNAALAEASSGKKWALVDALESVVRLGPIKALQYLHYSRLAQRIWPRLKLRLRGAM